MNTIIKLIITFKTYTPLEWCINAEHLLIYKKVTHKFSPFSNRKLMMIEENNFILNFGWGLLVLIYNNSFDVHEFSDPKPR